MRDGLVLERQRFSDKATYGSMYWNGDFLCYTMERPWRENKGFISCVPEGDYSLTEHAWKGKYNVYALVGDTVSHWPSEKARNLILIHWANKVSELSGCISCGEEIVGSQLVGSKNACLDVFRVIQNNNVSKLTII